MECGTTRLHTTGPRRISPDCSTRTSRNSPPLRTRSETPARSRDEIAVSPVDGPGLFRGIADLKIQVPGGYRLAEMDAASSTQKGGSDRRGSSREDSQSDPKLKSQPARWRISLEIRPALAGRARRAFARCFMGPHTLRSRQDVAFPKCASGTMVDVGQAMVVCRLSVRRKTAGDEKRSPARPAANCSGCFMTDPMLTVVTLPQLLSGRRAFRASRPLRPREASTFQGH